MFGVKKLAAKKQVGHFFRLIAALDYPGLLSVWFRLRAALKWSCIHSPSRDILKPHFFNKKNMMLWTKCKYEYDVFHLWANVLQLYPQFEGETPKKHSIHTVSVSVFGAVGLSHAVLQRIWVVSSWPQNLLLTLKTNSMAQSMGTYTIRFHMVPYGMLFIY